jgi:hypothetical protein
MLDGAKERQLSGPIGESVPFTRHDDNARRPTSSWRWTLRNGAPGSTNFESPAGFGTSSAAS